MSATRNSAAVYILAVAVAVSVIYFALSQPRISIEDGHPYDAQVYYTMAEQVAAGESISALRPFAYRIGLPFVVGNLFPEHIDFGFRLINLLFALATLGVFCLFLRSFRLSIQTVLLLLLLFVWAPQSPFRFVHFIPAYSDPPALFFIVFFLYLTQTVQNLDLRRTFAVTTLAVAGVLFREIAICGVLVFVFGQCARLQSRPPWVQIRNWRNFWLALIPLAACAIVLALLHFSIDGTGGYRYFSQMAGVVSQLARRPDIFLLAWLTTFGAIPLVLLFAAGTPLRDFVAENQPVAVFLFGCVLLALCSGFHTDRIVFWSFPAVLLLFGVFLERHSLSSAPAGYRLAFHVPLLLAQVLAWRIWLPIPDDPQAELFDPGAPQFLLFAPFGETTLGHTYASTLPAASRLALLGQYFLLALYFGIVLWLARRRQSRVD